MTGSRAPTTADRAAQASRSRAAARRHGSAERGSAALELVVLAPVLVALIGAALAAGRVALAHGSVDAAARDAARQASIARTPGTAQSQATASASASLRSEGIACPPRVRVDTSGFARPLGAPATVTATVSCTVSLADLTVPGLPGRITLSSHFASPLDPYRGRG